jgi:hypothetical protein
MAMIAGWEVLSVQRDVSGLTPADGEELSVWAARAFRVRRCRTCGALIIWSSHHLVVWSLDCEIDQMTR